MVSGLPTGTVTFLFSDVEGSTELSRQHGAAWGDLRAEHRGVLGEAFAEHGGAVVETEGDALFVVFDRATDAVAAAVAAQRALEAATDVRVRIGIHTTEPHVHTDGYVGVGVSRSARICAAAHGGQIVLSHATAGIVEDQNLAGVGLRDLGEHTLKDIPQPQRLFQVEAEGLQSEFPSLAAPSLAGSIGTLLITDLDGWGQIMRQLGDDAASAAATSYHRIVEELVRAHNGRVVERSADATLLLFSRPEEAVVTAALMRRALVERDWVELLATSRRSARRYTPDDWPEGRATSDRRHCASYGSVRAPTRDRFSSHTPRGRCSRARSSTGSPYTTSASACCRAIDEPTHVYELVDEVPINQ